MKWPLLLIALFLLANVQVFPFMAWTMAGTFPNLFICLLLFCALHLPWHQTLATALAIGFCQDLLSAYPYHLHSLLCLWMAVTVYSVREWLFHDHVMTQILLAGAAMGSYQSAYIFLVNRFYLPALPALSLWGQAGIIMLYTASVMPLFHRAAQAARRYA